MVELLLHKLKKRRRHVGSDAIHVRVVGPGFPLEVDVLHSGDLENSQAKIAFGGAAFGLELEVDAIAVAFVVFLVPSSD